MKKVTWLTTVFFLSMILFSGVALAQKQKAQPGPDITQDPLSGPGSISIQTKGNLMMSFGTMARVIPISENDYDFGFEDEADKQLNNYNSFLSSLGVDGFDGLFGGAFGTDFFQIHANEAGWVANNWIRTDVEMYFNVMPKDRKWALSTCLEFDRPVDTTITENRSGFDETSSDFGLERLAGTYKVTDSLYFKAGWDRWGIPEPAGIVHGDSNAPGFWLNGKSGSWDYSLGYVKEKESNAWYNSPDFETTEDNADRDLFGGWGRYSMSENHRLMGFYLFDKIRNVPVGSLSDRLLAGYADNFKLAEPSQAATFESFLGVPIGPNGALYEEAPETDSHYAGALYEGSVGRVSFFIEGIYQFGSADDTGLDQVNDLHTTDGSITGEDDYDISAYAASGDVELDLSDLVGMTFKPHLGFIYTSGDDDASDDELGGYTGVLTYPRFTRFGQESTIVGDANWLMGSVVYSYLPGLYGNGTPIVIGGLNNTTGLGTARGDNPGLTQGCFGFTLAPNRQWIFKSNVLAYWWNEDVNVRSWVDVSNPFTTNSATYTKVDSDYVGTEWDNELTYAMTRYTFVKFHASALFPGAMMEDITEARAAYTQFNPLTGESEKVMGEEADDVAYRLGMSFIWKF